MSYSNEKLKKYINGRSCAILGLGVSNLPLAETIFDFGVELTVIDKRAPEELGDAALSLRDRGVKFICGNNAFDDIDSELMIRSPAVHPDSMGIIKALMRGAELTSETELFMRLTSADTYAVTGSDGKTTSTTLTGKFLEAHAKRIGIGRVYVGGNIGTPLLPICSEMTENDVAVLELSSFQLMTAVHSAKCAAITNISPNHLDWHLGGMLEYEWAKAHVIGAQTERAVFNFESKGTEKLMLSEAEKACRELFIFSSTRTDVSDFSSILNTNVAKKGLLKLVFERDGYIVVSDGISSERVLAVGDIILPGRHNVENYMTAIALTYEKVDTAVYGEVARSFRGVEHRLELVRTLDGVDYYNSSIDSSPTRTAAALSALGGRDIVVICGGYDKNIPFEPLAKALCKSVRAVVLTGATADKIKKVLLAHADFDPEKLTVAHEPNFECAVKKASTLAKKGGCVLLSPACASFDAFKNFAERGNKFREIVSKL